MKEHSITLKVRYCEVDRQDVVYHANYFTWFDMGRIGYLHDQGVSYKEMENQGTLLVVTRADIRYLSPARLEDQLKVITRPAKVTKSRITFTYEILRESDQRLLTTGNTELACVDREGRSIRLPKNLQGIETS